LHGYAVKAFAGHWPWEPEIGYFKERSDLVPSLADQGSGVLFDEQHRCLMFIDISAEYLRLYAFKKRGAPSHFRKRFERRAFYNCLYRGSVRPAILNGQTSITGVRPAHVVVV
jgi:hypothetical protein